LLKYRNLSFFSIWRPAVILDLWGKFCNSPQQEFGGLYHCAKFGWNRISRSDNTKVLTFSVFGLKMPTHALFGCFGGKIGKMETFCIVIHLERDVVMSLDPF